MDITQFDPLTVALFFILLVSLVGNATQLAQARLASGAPFSPSQVVADAVQVALTTIAQAEELHAGDNTAKKAFVLDYLKKYVAAQKWGLSDELIDVIIEGAVTQFKNAITPHA